MTFLFKSHYWYDTHESKNQLPGSTCEWLTMHHFFDYVALITTVKLNKWKYASNKEDKLRSKMFFEKLFATNSHDECHCLLTMSLLRFSLIELRRLWLNSSTFRTGLALNTLKWPATRNQFNLNDDVWRSFTVTKNRDFLSESVIFYPKNACPVENHFKGLSLFDWKTKKYLKQVLFSNLIHIGF